MTESVTVKHFAGVEIDGIVRLKDNGTLMTLHRDERGMQQSTTLIPEKTSKKFGIFVKLPVLSGTGKKRSLEIDLCTLYQEYFPNQPLPPALQKGVEAPLKQSSTTVDLEQLDLF